MNCLLCRKEIDGVEVVEANGHIQYEIQALSGVDASVNDVHVCQPCGVNYLRERYEDKYAKVLEPLFKEINSTTHNLEGENAQALANAFCSEHRYLQAQFIEFMSKVLGILGQRADDPMWIDARNAYAFKYLKKLSQVEL